MAEPAAFGDNQIMRAGKAIKRAVLAVVVAAVLAAGGMYIQASRVPAGYAPAQLSADQKNQAVKEFWSKVQDFGNDAQATEPFVWSVSAEQINRYLASMDEIASSTPSGQPGRVYREMAEAGLAQPAVHLADGVITLMIRSTEHEKILSVRLSQEFTADGQLRVRLDGAAVGRLPLPRSWVNDQLAEAKRMLPSGQRPDLRQAGLNGLSAEDVAAVLGTVLAAVGSEPIDPEMTWPVNRKRVRITGINVADGQLTLRVKPIGRSR